jgi:hypothetical protein
MQKKLGRPISSMNLQHRDGCWFIILDLVSLIQRVQEFIRANELAMAADEPDDTVTDIVVLDDVTPRYLMANATLNVCRAQLHQILNSLLQARTAHGERHYPSALLCTGPQSLQLGGECP